MIGGKFSDPRGGTAMGVRIVTGSKKAEIVGKNDDGTLKVHLKSNLASDTAANDELVALIAKQLGVTKDSIEIVAGHDQSDKIVTIEGITTEDAEVRLGLV